MKRKDLIALYKTLNTLGNLKGAKFSYAVAKNISKIEPEVKVLEKSIEASPEFIEYEKQRVELAKEHSEKDEKGEALVENGNYKVLDTFAPAFEEFKKEYADLIEAREKQINDYNELLEEETDVDLYKVKMVNLPEEITAQQTYSIMAIIEE